MFQFPAFPPPDWECGKSRGRSHSGIPGSTAACASPGGLIAACHALRRRPPEPSHPPDGLGSLPPTQGGLGIFWVNRPVHGPHRDPPCSGGSRTFHPKRGGLGCAPLRGGPAGIRTRGLRLAKPTLSQAELPAHGWQARHPLNPPRTDFPAIGGDRAVGSPPTATLLRLLPPLTEPRLDPTSPRREIRPHPDPPARWSDGRCVQGAGTYSPRDDDTRVLGIPASRGRVAARDPNWGGFRGGFPSPFGGVGSHCPAHCSARVARGGFRGGILTYRRPLLPPAYRRRSPPRVPPPPQREGLATGGARVSLVTTLKWTPHGTS